jgi:hypothetical protein
MRITESRSVIRAPDRPTGVVGHEPDKNVALMLRRSDISRRKATVAFPFLRSWRSLLTISFEKIRDFVTKLSKALNPTAEIT